MPPRRKPAAPVERMSLTAYARSRGVTDQAIRSAIKDGRIVEGASQDSKGRWSVVPSVADRELAQNSSIDHAARRGFGTAETVYGSDAPSETDGAPADPERMTLAEAKRVRAVAEAQLKKLELAERRGRLVPIEAVEVTVGKQFANVRQRLLAVPARVAHEVALLDDVAQVRLRIEAAITQALTDLVEAAAYEPPRPEA